MVRSPPTLAVALPAIPTRQHATPQHVVSINEGVLRLLRQFLLDMGKFREMLVSSGAVWSVHGCAGAARQRGAGSEARCS